MTKTPEAWNDHILAVYDMTRTADPGTPPPAYYPLLAAIERMRRVKGEPKRLELPEDRPAA